MLTVRRVVSVRRRMALFLVQSAVSSKQSAPVTFHSHWTGKSHLPPPSLGWQSVFNNRHTSLQVEELLFKSSKRRDERERENPEKDFPFSGSQQEI